MRKYRNTNYAIENLKIGFIMAAIGGLVMLANECAGQTYKVGATAANGLTVKTALSFEIIVSDSTVTFKSGSEVTKRKISNRTENIIYVTDGTVTDRIGVTQMAGRVKGFTYTHTLSYQTDSKYGSILMLYYCTKNN
jgi:hypothetical protein